MDIKTAQAVMEELNNWFERSRYSGPFSISGGSLQGVDMIDGQYFRIIGSAMNDGLHQWPCNELVDEEFTGSVCGLAVPSTFADTVDDISEWMAKHPKANTGYSSESFGGYSYSLPVNQSSGQVAGWQDVFRGSLNKWRRLPCL